MRALNTLKSKRGFTLIEMAIVIMILGLLIAVFSPLYSLYVRNQKLEATQDNIITIASNIGTFRSINGRYPCPASLTADRGDLNYGREDCTNLSFSGLGAQNVAPGGCYEPDANTRICVEQSTRTPVTYIYPEGNAAQTASPRVLVGAIPFRHLHMPEEEAYDGNNNRILYVVTENLTCANCFQANQGGIQILDQTGNTAITPNAAGQTAIAHFLILSAGENGNGAIAPNGTQLPCPVGGPENENCDFLTNPDATYQMSDVRSTGNAGADFDDVLSYFTQDEIPLWQASASTNFAIHQKTSGNVGFAATAALPINEQGQVTGRARAGDDPDTGASDGQFQAVQYCNTANAFCMESNLLAGADPDMTCPPGQFMHGVANGAAICEDEIIVRCANGQTVRGIRADGTLNCGTAPACLSGTGRLCGTNFTLPAAANGTTHTLTAGVSAQRVYTCSNGSWSAAPQTGLCTCTPTPVGGINETLTCADGFDGTYTRTTVTTCPDGNTTVTNDAATACNCLAFAETDPLSCPTGFTNNGYHRTRNHVCTDAHTGYWEDWVYHGSCDCVPATQTETVDCGGGLDGTKTVQNDFICPSGEWTGWYDADTSGCTCTVDTIFGTIGCPPDQMGYIEVQATKECPSGEYGDWVEVAGGNHCVPKPPVVCGWNNQDSGIIQSTPVGPPKGENCAPCGGMAPHGCHLMLDDDKFRNYSSCICE